MKSKVFKFKKGEQVAVDDIEGIESAIRGFTETDKDGYDERYEHRDEQCSQYAKVGFQVIVKRCNKFGGL